MRRAAPAWALALLLAGPVATACHRRPAGSRAAAGVVVREDTQVVLTGPIGGREKQDATFVLVDVDNRSTEDLLVAVDGELRDAAGRRVGGALVPDDLRVPAGGTRTFALVHPGVVREAVSAALRVRSADPVAYTEPVVVTDVTTGRDGGRLFVTGKVRNREGRPAAAQVIATFYDGGGRILKRPFTVLQIHGGQYRPFRFDGPPGAERATMFAGDSSF